MLNRSQGMSEITYAERLEDAIDKAAGETHSIYLSIDRKKEKNLRFP